MRQKCLTEELNRLKESSREAVENINQFSEFKQYMHIEREVQKDLEQILSDAKNSVESRLILVCGSVGDGKSHLLSYFRNQDEELRDEFIFHNDATESFSPNKTSIEQLNELLDPFCDEKLGHNQSKIILAINLGTLNNFIDSEYGDRFTMLKEFIITNKILELEINNTKVSKDSHFQYINFTDYHIFTLENAQVKSEYIKSIINKVVSDDSDNVFARAYRECCEHCEYAFKCPIKENFNLLRNEKIQNSLVELLVKATIKYKVIISTRALLNFVYELIVPTTYLDVNLGEFKDRINRMQLNQYISALLPNVIFEHKELSAIFEAMHQLDPVNLRNSSIDDFIIQFNNEDDYLSYLDEYVEYENTYILENAGNAEKSSILKFVIRACYLAITKEQLLLEDKIYDDYIRNLYYFNKGDKLKLKEMYNKVKNGILSWNGDAGKDYMNISVGQKQTQYSIKEKIELRPDTSNLKQDTATEIKKFMTSITLGFKNENIDKGYFIDIDYNLYTLLDDINHGYYPNKRDKNQFINFVDFLSKVECLGSKSQKVYITEKNKKKNKKYRLEFDDDFGIYTFTEIE